MHPDDSPTLRDAGEESVWRAWLNTTPEPVDLGVALDSATRQQDLAHVRQVLALLPEPCPARTRAMKTAARAGWLAGLEVLLLPEIEPGVILAAARGGHKAVVDMLWPYSSPHVALSSVLLYHDPTAVTLLESAVAQWEAHREATLLDTELPACAPSPLRRSRI